MTVEQAAPATPESGATPPAPAEPAPTAPADPAAAAMNTDAGKTALAELRAQNKAMAAQLKELEGLKPLAGLAQALGVKPEQGKTDTETLTATVAELQRKQQESELKATRLEVAAEKGLTPQQAARLSGSTREELAKDADDLKALFPGTQPPGTPGTPRPDPSQGTRGSVPELQAALQAAQAKGDAKESIRLKSILAAQKTTT